MAGRLGIAVENLRTLSVDAEASQLQFRRSHQTFFSNCQLSLCVAFMVTLVGAPSYCAAAKDWLFGQEGCTEADLFRKVMVNGTLETYYPEVHTNPSEVIWCGWLPNNYLANWPNLVQMIVFTVYQNTGTTVMQAWQGMIGTFMAVLNVFVMDQLFPHESVGLVAWADTLIFIFLVLISGSQENTMKFAMSWHVFFMMTFLDPNHANGQGEFPTGIPRLDWDQYTVVVFVTAVAGVILAVVTTVIPPPGLLNYIRVVDDAEVALQAVSKIWTEAIDYFCGHGRSARRFVVAEAITSMNSTVSNVQGNLSNSWWETLDLLGFGKKRLLFNTFDTTLQKTGSVMVAVQDSVLTEDFGSSHTMFCDGLHKSMVDLKTEAVSLLERCQKSCKDGDIDEVEVEEIDEAIEDVKASQLRLLEKYKQLSSEQKGAQFISQDLSNENEFIFALSVWARKITDFATNIIKIDADLDSHTHSCGMTLCETVKRGFINTWRLPTREKTIWALRNFIPISFAFWCGWAMPCPMVDAFQAADGEVESCSKTRILASVFTPYDANMANTLGLLINHYPGSALINNIMRLLGVTLGKVMPIVLLGGLNIMRRGSPEKAITTALVLFIFTWGTNYMYYASKRWSTVGCLMAGFGCAMLIAPMTEEALTDYGPKYKEIAQVVMAIVMQIIIDAIFDCIQDDFPRDSAVKKVGSLREALLRAFTAFFEGDLSDMQQASNDARGLLDEAKTLQHEADPEVQLVPCYRTDFKIGLYQDALKVMELLVSDVAMLILAVSSWRVDPPPKDGNDTSALEVQSDDEDGHHDFDELDPLEYLPGLNAVTDPGGLKDELLHAVDIVLASLEAMLGHGSEDNSFQEVDKTMELLNMRIGEFTRGSELYDEINRKPFTAKYMAEGQVCEDPRAKVTMAVRSLERAKVHIGEIEKLMMPYIML